MGVRSRMTKVRIVPMECNLAGVASGVCILFDNVGKKEDETQCLR